MCPSYASLMCTVQQSVDISCQPDPQQQTCSTEFAAVGPCWDRRTGRPTDALTLLRIVSVGVRFNSEYMIAFSLGEYTRIEH